MRVDGWYASTEDIVCPSRTVILYKIYATPPREEPVLRKPKTELKNYRARLSFFSNDDNERALEIS